MKKILSKKPLIAIGFILMIAALGGMLLVRTKPVLKESGLHPQNERLQSVYEMDWTLNTESRELRGHQKIDYVNADTVALHAIYFHLYPNYFTSEDHAPYDADEMLNAYPEGFSAGGIKINGVTVNGEKEDFKLEGERQGVLRIDLSVPLKPGKRISCTLDYTVILPICVGRFGVGSDTIQLCNAYPVAAVYDDEGWNLDPYYPVGDPFYSDVSDYTVRITCPSDYTVTGTGKQNKLAQGGGKTTYTFACPDVRDVAYVAGKELKSLSGEAEGVKVTSWYYSDGEMGQFALDSACASVKAFTKLYGAYPYPELNVIESDLYFGGMEYPNAVLITNRLYKKNSKTALEYVIAHEVAHQWWYGVIGNDEIDEPWLDEALTEYSTLLYYKVRYGEERFASEYARNIDLTLAMFNYTNQELLPVGLKTSETRDTLWYTLSVYKQGARMFRDLHKKMGDSAFLNAMRAYYKDMRFLNATKSDLLCALNLASGSDLSDFLNAYLNGKQ